MTIDSFTGFVHWPDLNVYSGGHKIALIISKHAPEARQLRLRVQRGEHIYQGDMTRRGGPSRVTFKLMRRPNGRASASKG